MKKNSERERQKSREKGKEKKTASERVKGGQASE